MDDRVWVLLFLLGRHPVVCSQLLSPVAFGYFWHSLRCLCTLLASRRHSPYVDRMLIREIVCRVRFSWSVPALDQFGASLRAQAFFALAKRFQLSVVGLQWVELLCCRECCLFDACLDVVDRHCRMLGNFVCKV